MPKLPVFGSSGVRESPPRRYSSDSDPLLLVTEKGKMLAESSRKRKREEHNPFEGFDPVEMVKQSASFAQMASQIVQKKFAQMEEEIFSFSDMKGKIQSMENDLFEKETVIATLSKKNDKLVREIQAIKSKAQRSETEAILHTKLAMADDFRRGAQGNWDMNEWERSLKRLKSNQVIDLLDVMGSKREIGSSKMN